MYSSFKRLFNSLSKTREAIRVVLKDVLSKRISSADINELEFLLLGADIGVKTTDDIIQWLKNHKGKNWLRRSLETYLLSILESIPITQQTEENARTVYLIVGVNGTGKTTSAAKLGYYLKKKDQSVMLIGADTYRAAAIEQLEKWSNLAGLKLICNREGGDPSSVVYDGLVAAKARNFQCAIIDTAGRLHTYKNLMFEVEKMYRVIQTKFPEFILHTYLTLDANLGQNSLIQAREFNKHVPLNGIILTKMDGTAKGGIVFPIYREMKIPVTFIGLGEDLDDFIEFNPRQYVKSIVGSNNEDE